MSNTGERRQNLILKAGTFKLKFLSTSSWESPQRFQLEVDENYTFR